MKVKAHNPKTRCLDLYLVSHQHNIIHIHNNALWA